MRKITLVVAAIFLVLIFFALDLNSYLSLHSLKVSLGQFEAWRAASPVLVGLSFLLFYVIVAALSLPGAAVLTLAAGALFGLLWGTVIVSLPLASAPHLPFWSHVIYFVMPSSPASGTG